MSSALLRKSLALCDPDSEDQPNEKPRRKSKHQQKPKARVTKLDKTRVLTSSRKETLAEARKKLTDTKTTRIEPKKLRKLKKEQYALELNDEIVKIVLERAGNRKPIQNKEPEAEEGTVFTEEDFKAFEAEYHFD